VASRRTWMDERAHDVNLAAVGETIGDSPAWSWQRSGRRSMRTRWLWRHGGGQGRTDCGENDSSQG
jgi:hypothetical protein